MPKTISFHNGSDWSRGHNVRDKRFIKQQAHIDTSLSDNNIVLVDELVRKAYDRIFGEAVKEYNAKQKRADRRIDSYYNKIKQDKRKHIVYECIVQIGDKDDTGNNAPLEKEALKRFADNWEQRNPNLKLIGAYIHGDEPDGTVHMHIDYIPAAECSRGMKLQNSLDKALEQQGFHTQNIKQTAQIAWQDRERKALIDICKELGIDVHQNPQGITKGREHLSKIEYQQLKETARKQMEWELLQYQSLVNDFLQSEPQNAIEGVPVPSIAKKFIGKENRDKLLYSPAEIEEVKKLAKAVAVASAANEQRSSELSLKADELSEREYSVAEKEKTARKMMNNIEETEREVQFKLQQAERNYQEMQKDLYVVTLQKRIKELDTASDKLAADWHEEHQKCEKTRKALNAAEKEIAPLKQQNGELSERIRVLEENIQILNSKLAEKEKELTETENGMEYNYKLYNSACDIGEYLGKKWRYDFNALVNEHMENKNKSVESIVDGKTQQAEWER